MPTDIGANPDVKPEVKPEVNAEVKPIIQPEVKPEVKPETKPEVKDNTTILGEDGKPKEEKKEEVKQGAPEKYTDFILPEGVKIEPALLEKATAEFKALGLSQEQAQKLVALQAESAKSYTDTTLANFQQQVETWKQESTALYGAKSKEEFGIAAQAVNRFGSPELRAMLNETGIGNNPELVKYFNKVGHAIKEESPNDGMRVNEKASDADVFYPKMKK